MAEGRRFHLFLSISCASFPPAFVCVFCAVPRSRIVGVHDNRDDLPSVSRKPRMEDENISIKQKMQICKKNILMSVLQQR